MTGVALTGVGGVFCAAHRPKGGGQMHGHSWEVIVWLPRCDATEAKTALADFLKQFDHGVLPDFITQGEDLARHICMTFKLVVQPRRARKWLRPVRVHVNRPLEHIYAEWSVQP